MLLEMSRWLQRAPPVTNVLRHIERVRSTTLIAAAWPKLDGTMPQRMSMMALGPLGTHTHADAHRRTQTHTDAHRRTQTHTDARTYQLGRTNAWAA